MNPFDQAWALLKFDDWESEGDPFAPPPPPEPPVNPTEALANEIGLEYPIVHIESDPAGYFLGYQCGKYATTGQLFGGIKANASFINEMFGQRHLQSCEQCQSALHIPQNTLTGDASLNLSERQKRNYQ